MNNLDNNTNIFGCPTVANQTPVAACGDPDCSCSTGMNEELTFGSGKLDEHGYWEFPCLTCAIDWDRQRGDVFIEKLSQGVSRDCLDFCTRTPWPLSQKK